MAALNNRVLLRSLSEETFDFSGNSVISVAPAENIDLISAKLSVDTAEMTVEYVQGEGEDIRTLPYGTPVWHYIGGDLKRKHYVKEIRQIAKNRFTISTISAVGLLDKQYHRGGVYRGETVEDLLEELIDEAVPYTVDEDVAATEVFGYLPYATKRDNLHQLLFAENISIIKDSAGDMRFTFLKIPSTVPEIDENRIFMGASVNYPAIASKIRLTEHSYQYDENLERVTLIDNSGKAKVSNKLFVFENAPIVVESIQTEGLTVNEAGVNYAIVSGSGIMTGIPYYDKTSAMIKESSGSTGEKHEISASDITLVTAINSDNVAERLLSYYTSRETVSADIKVTTEKCGGVYTFTDAFGSTVRGYLTKMTQKVTAIIKAACEFICGYEPETFGNNYSFHLAVEVPGTIHVPAGTKQMRVVLIGGGDAGSSGLAGEEPEFDSSSFENIFKNQSGGKGGEPGEEGAGGLIRELVISNPVSGDWTCVLGLGGEGTDWNDSDTTHLRSQNYQGGHTVLYKPGQSGSYSTDHNSSYRSDSGIADLFTGVVYAKKGLPGVKGGNGGDGAASGDGAPGEDVEYRGRTMHGGPGGKGIAFQFERVSRNAKAGGAGGDGADGYRDGYAGRDAYVSWYYDATAAAGSSYKAVEYVGLIPGSPSKMGKTSLPIFNHSNGDGGYAGCGGFGRGGYGNSDRFLDQYEVTENNQTKKVLLQADLFRGTAYYANSGPGGPGEQGYQGAIIIYSDKELTFTPLTLETPTITNTTTSASTSNTFTFVTVAANTSYQIERRPVDGDWMKLDVVEYTSANTQVTYEDTGTDQGETFEYRIKALGLGSAQDSDYSNSIIAAWGVQKLATPVLSLEQETWGILITWTESQNATEYLLAWRILNSGIEWTYALYSVGSRGEYGLTAGLFPVNDSGYTYEIKVCGLTSDGSYGGSDWSNIEEESMPTSMKPKTPVLTSAEYYDAGGEYDTDGIIVRWENFFISAGERFVIQRKRHSAQAADWETIAISDAPQQGYYFNAFPTTVGDVYDYRVKSIKTGWTDSEWSETYTVTVTHNLPAPTFATLEDAGSDYVALNVSVTDIDSHAGYLVFEVNVNGGGWSMYKSPIPLTGGQSWSGTYAEVLTGGSIKYGGTIEMRCYITASGYTNSDYSTVKTVVLKERVFFWDSETSQYWDCSTGTYKTGLNNGWQGYQIWYDTNTGEEYYPAPSFYADADNAIQMSSNGCLMTKGPVCAASTALSSIYSKICLYGDLIKAYASGFARFGSANMWARSDNHLHLDWSGQGGGTYYVEPGRGGYDPTAGELTNPSVSPNTKRASQLGWGIGTYIGFQINGGGIKAKAVFAIKR